LNHFNFLWGRAGKERDEMKKNYISFILVVLLTWSTSTCSLNGGTLLPSDPVTNPRSVDGYPGFEEGENASGNAGQPTGGTQQHKGDDDPMAENGKEKDSGADIDSGMAADSGMETGVDTETGVDADTDTKTDEETDSNPESDLKPGQATPPVFGFIDAHADTITRALLPHNNADLFSNNLHVDFKRLSEFNAPVQVFVLWCSDTYVSNAYEYTNSLLDFFESEVAKHSDIIEIALTLEDLQRNAQNNKISAIISIEGGEALMGKLENVDHFFNRGVRIMSLTWNRENELGYGQATGSTKGLKPFGMEVLKRMDELGIILDVSHVNEAGFWDAHSLSTRPYMASHSNAYSVTPHNRNLKDAQIRAIADRGGITGLVLYPLILSQRSSANIDDYMAHIRHFIDQGAGANLGLGSDFDGFGTMPEGFTDVSSYKMLAEKIAEEFGEDTSNAIMYGNFYDFFVRYYNGN